MHESNIEIATKYLSWGLSVVPVRHFTKMPSNEWKAFQTRHANQTEIQDWFKDIMQGLGVVCGSISGNLVCFDFDAPGAYEHFLELHPWAELLPTAQSSRGKHVFFRSPEPLKSQALYLEGFEGKAGDLIAERKFVVLPPTLHPSGTRRKWIVPLEQDIPVFPLSDFDLASPPESTNTFDQGDRHNSLLNHAVQLAKDGVSAHDLPAAVRLANQRLCKPPLPVSEVDGIIQFVLANCIIISPPHTPPTDDDQSFQDNSSFIIISPLSRKGTDDDQNLATLFSAAPEYMTAQDSTGQLEWLVEGFLPLSYLVILGATSKAGKSCLATHLAHAICTGTDFLGMPTKQVPVLWIAYEENEAERRLILHHYQPVSDKLYISHEKILIDSDSGIEALRYWVQKTNAGLVVLDPLYCAVGAESLSDGRKARGALEGMKELCRTENVAALILHHLTKNVDAGLTRERFADSNQILATASMDWIMESRDIENESREIRLHSTGRGAFANKTWVIHSESESSYTLVDCGSKGDITRCSIEKSIMNFMETTHTGVTAETIAEATGNKVRAVRNTLTTLVRDNQLFVTGKRGKAAIYSAEQPLCVVDSDNLSWM